MNIKLAIFDFDGTLADTRQAIIAAKQEAMQRNDLPVLDEAACASTIGYTAREGFRRLYPDAAEAVLDSVTADYRALFEEKKQIMPPTLFPGVVEMLDTLHGMGITCTIATARHTDSCYEILGNLGIRDRFSYILCGESTQNLKPHPEAVLKTLADLHFAPEEAMVIGDMPMDMLMGKGADAYACGVTYGNADRETLLAAGADFVIDHIAALAGVIRGEA